MPSNNLDKYEYLTGEYLKVKPTVTDQARFEFSPLNRVSNKGMNKEEKTEGLLKRLKNIEEKSRKQLKVN